MERKEEKKAAKGREREKERGGRGHVSDDNRTNVSRQPPCAAASRARSRARVLTPLTARWCARGTR